MPLEDQCSHPSEQEIVALFAGQDVRKAEVVATAFLRYESHWRYCMPLRKWLRWNGQRWEIDDTELVLWQISEFCDAARVLTKAVASRRKLNSCAFMLAVERHARKQPLYNITLDELEPSFIALHRWRLRKRRQR